MKHLLVALICIGLMSQAALAQEDGNELENHYHDVQYQAEGLHTYMKGTFDNVRYGLSGLLYLINNSTLERALTVIEYTDEIIEIVDDYISQATGPQACVDAVAARWAVEKYNIGSRLSACSQMAEDRIVGLYTPLYNVVEAAQRTSNSVQNLVVRTLAEWNPLQHDYGLDYLVELEIERLYIEFTTVTVPTMQLLMEAIEDEEENLPEDMYICSATAANEFNIIAGDIELDVWLC